ncbi:MAG: hypothetical protein NVSMB56_10250 [Pyrinomonadaceae bacterium]
MQSRRIFISLFAILALIASTFVFAQQRRRTQEPRRGLSVKENNAANGKRFALVIGNGEYATVGALKNPSNDARAIARALRGYGFDVIERENATQQQMRQAVRKFGENLRTAGAGSVGLFYFAGHGVQLRDHNYLIPVDAQIETEADVEDGAVSADYVLGQMADAQNSLNIVILDACRNNPFARSFRSASRGLAQMNAPTGTLIAYATAPGSVASDGTGGNGLYTQELLTAIKEPNMSVENVFKRVRINVIGKSAGKQTPWDASSLTGEFYFNAKNGEGAGGETATKREPSKVPLVDTESELWEQIRGNASADDLRDYLKEYPTGAHAAVARVMLRRLETPGGAANNATNNTSGNNAAKSSAAKPRTVQNRYGIELIYIPSGSFRMGGTGQYDGKPVHEVNINYSFYMGRTEVTQAQWQAVMGNNPSKFKGDNLPVEQVSWNDAQEFISKLNELNDGYKYRLPSEAEWEYACRAGTTGDYAGNIDDMAW